MTTYEVSIPEELQNRRVDTALCALFPEITRSQIDQEHTTIMLDGKIVKKSRKVTAGQIAKITMVIEQPDIVPEEVPLQIIYEDQKVVVINKEQGMVVHPGAGNFHGTLVQGLLYRYRELIGTDPLRPGVVHRLDKETSGVIIAARDPITVGKLASQFKERTTTKVYIALLEGRMEKRRGVIKSRIFRDPKDRKRFSCAAVDDPRDGQKGKFAQTNYHVLKQFDQFALVRIHLLTGRTHQIRAHAQWIGNPVVGDPVYGRRKSPFGNQSLMLHALRLSIDIPEDSSFVRRTFFAPMPERFKRLIRSAIDSRA